MNRTLLEFARMRRLALLVSLALVLPACGGGSTGTASVTSSIVDLGTVSATTPSRLETTFPNPLPGAATVTTAEATGPFTVDEVGLPAEVARGGSVELGLFFVPQGEGRLEGEVSLRFEGPGGPLTRTYEIHADGERIQWTILTPTLDFGAVEVGGARELQAQVLNLTSLSPVTLTSALLPGAEFEILEDPFPLTVQPGAAAAITVRYAPEVAGVDDGDLVLGPNDVGGGLVILIMAETISADLEQIIDFGQQSLDGNGRTPVLSVSVPADAISLTLEGHIDGTISTPIIGLDALTGPDGKVYENSSSTGSLVWEPGWEIFSSTIPNTDRADVQLVQGGGTYQFRLRRLQGPGGSMHVRAIVERRPEAIKSLGKLDLNVFLAQGITPTAETAANDTRLQAVLTRIDGILAEQGVRLGEITYYDVEDESLDEVTTNGEFSELLELTRIASATRLNLFFLKVAFGGGVVGVSATVGGPKKNGTESSGVMSVYDGYSTNTIGLIAAHEIGHFLGLYHTVEENGSHDFIDDTLECPSSGSDDVCTQAGGGYLMHWQALGGSTITDGQGRVLRGHPHVGPGSAQASPLSMRLTVEDLGELLSLPRQWCGTCSGCLDHGKR